jgi:regulating synaptic membrane exocytosis protein 2
VTEFVEGLGPGQLVGRQVLGTTCLGEIQLGLFDRKGHLEVEVIRARGLCAKSATKILPAPYAKVYLLEGKNCLEKQKTTVTRRTLDHLNQQQLIFMESYQDKVIQVSIF